jgi:Flp pilus assembly protein TadD
MMRLRAPFFSFTFILCAGAVAAQQSGSMAASTPPGAAVKAAATDAEQRAALHASPDWELVVGHLPDPATAGVERLELAGDVLRARRFPEDALEYYGYALARGGSSSELLKKMGVARLELNQSALAHEMFQRSVRARKNDSEAWNDLGVSDYAMGQYRSAIGEYKRAVRLNKGSAVFHSNLGMAYLEVKDAESARAEFGVAAHLDPNIMEAGDHGGVIAHVLATQNYGELCFEMATLAAREHRPEAVRLWLAKANERGFDVRDGMGRRDVLRPWLKDAEVATMLDNGARIRKRSVATVVPSLGEAVDPSERMED